MTTTPHVASALPHAIDEHPWRTDGLFSPHFLLHRLPNPHGIAWPDAAEAEAVFEFAKTLFAQEHTALQLASEEDAEGHWIMPLLARLGFGVNPRKAIPGAASRLLPDFLLYASPAVAQSAFHSKEFYGDCLALLEAKRWAVNLSREGAKSKERSPQTQIRDYLSETPALFWGLLTNGGQWRLTCKRDRAGSFFEFDLARVLSAAQVPETEAWARRNFHLFYALFRRAAFERDPDGRCLLDGVREEAQQFKAEVERRLRVQVFDCVEILARGFLEDKSNALTADDLPAIYQSCLILLYRILFVLNAEARDLLPTHTRDTAAKKYYNSYGLEYIRRKLAAPEGTEYDDNGTFILFARLETLFALINGKPGPAGRQDKNAELGIPRYNGGLFDPARYPFLETKRVPDAFLADALRRLAYRTDGVEQVAFDYANLGERHLGSIYEGLLEHRLLLSPEGDLRLTNDKGERKTSGAYYTPEDWVSYIVSRTLQPLLDGIGRGAGFPIPADKSATLPSEGRDRPGTNVNGPGIGFPTLPSSTGGLPDSFAEAVLQLNVCDPAMGSGHFLVEAVAFLADAVAAHPTTAPRPLLNAEGQSVRDAAGEPVCTEEAKLAYWKRRLVEACIYGVDLNPLAVELAKLSLWLETVDRVPLNFLDHHLRCGNSLLGTTLAALPSYPELKKSSKKKKGGQLSLTFSADLADALQQAIAQIAAIESVSTDTHAAAKQKEQLWRSISETLLPRFRQAADLWLAPWFGADLGWLDFTTQFDSPEKTALLHLKYGAVSSLRPFHWELEFPDIFFDEHGHPKAAAGFDAVVGNPPWERIKLQENEFFAGRSPAIAHAPKASDRKKLIAALSQTDPELRLAYEAARDRAEQTQGFVHRSGFFPLMGRGDTNLYAVFAEKALQLVNPTGRVGLLVPSGIATDDTTKAYFQELVTHKRLAELLDFENRNAVFEDVHRSFKFSIILMTGANAPQPKTRCGFFLYQIADLDDPTRVFTLSPDDFALFNPNTLTCPIFRRRRDAELTRKIYENVPILLRETEAGPVNPWGVQLSTMFHMTNDTGLFRRADELEADGFYPDARDPGNVYTKGSVKYLPLYEGKMVQMYDHRAAGIIVNPANVHRPAQEAPTTLAQHQDPAYSPSAQFWIDRAEVRKSLRNKDTTWLMGYKDVTAPTNARTMIPSIIPLAGVGNTFCLVQTEVSLPVACLFANLSSFALDFAARQKVGGQHLNFFIVEQLPILPPARYQDLWHEVKLADFITERVLALCYTAHDLAGFAADLGHTGSPFPWDEENRLHQRCQLDALYFHLYGLTRDEAGEIMDTFPIVKRQDEAKYGGRFRTRDLILGYHSAYGAGNMDARVKG
jgi:hypothetical protein